MAIYYLCLYRYLTKPGARQPPAPCSNTKRILDRPIKLTLQRGLYCHEQVEFPCCYLQMALSCFHFTSDEFVVNFFSPLKLESTLCPTPTIRSWRKSEPALILKFQTINRYQQHLDWRLNLGILIIVCKIAFHELKSIWERTNIYTTVTLVENAFSHFIKRTCRLKSSQTPFHPLKLIPCCQLKIAVT